MRTNGNLWETWSDGHRAGIQSYYSSVFLYPDRRAQITYSCIICTKMNTCILSKIVSTEKGILQRATWHFLKIKVLLFSFAVFFLLCISLIWLPFVEINIVEILPFFLGNTELFLWQKCLYFTRHAKKRCIKEVTDRRKIIISFIVRKLWHIKCLWLSPPPARPHSNIREASRDAAVVTDHIDRHALFSPLSCCCREASVHLICSYLLPP